MTKRESSGAVTMPPTMGAAMRCVTSLPVPVAQSTGSRPATITGALLGVDPRAVCDVDMEKKHVAVESNFPPSDFIEALEEVGYSSFLAQV